MKPYILISILFVIFCGCAGNPYTSFYHPIVGDPMNDPALVPSQSEPKVLSFDPATIKQLRLSMFEDGYALVGYSSFNARSLNEKGAIAKAKAIGAEIVMLSQNYTNTISGNMPFTVPNPDQQVNSYYQGNINTYPAGNRYSYYGTSTTTVPGGYTTYNIPYSINRFDYAAAYWSKMKPSIFGVFVDEMPAELRQKVGRNQGVLISAVRKNSPAFDANILPGDVLVKIGEREIIDSQQCMQVIREFVGQTVDVQVLRGTETKAISVTIGIPTD